MPDPGPAANRTATAGRQCQQSEHNTPIGDSMCNSASITRMMRCTRVGLTSVCHSSSAETRITVWRLRGFALDRLRLFMLSDG